MCKSRATRRELITCNMCFTWYEGTAQLLSLTELKRIYFSFISLAETINRLFGMETGEPRENPYRRASENATIVVVCWLLNVPATCECISGTDLLRQFYVQPH